jgi:hypothetical protein
MMPKFTKAVLIGIFLLFAGAIGTEPADAHNKWDGGYRKWPWKAELTRAVTTLPNTPPHSNEFNQLAIDVGMNFETVYSVSHQGQYVEFTERFCLGWTLVMKDNDGTYMAYAHLDPDFVPDGGGKLPGHPLVRSGNSTGGGGIECSSGPHLHFARYSSRPVFDMTDRDRQLSLEPISAHGTPIDVLCACNYPSDNGGIGLDSNHVIDISFMSVYSGSGGYTGWGVTANLADLWSPCRNDSIFGTYFRYRCAPLVCCSGDVQTYLGTGETFRAIMNADGPVGTYSVDGSILFAYVERYTGQDWVYWIGYPTGNRFIINLSPLVYRQNFQFGYINFNKSTCRLNMYQNNVFITSYVICE